MSRPHTFLFFRSVFVVRVLLSVSLHVAYRRGFHRFVSFPGPLCPVLCTASQFPHSLSRITVSPFFYIRSRCLSLNTKTIKMCPRSLPFIRICIVPVDEIIFQEVLVSSGSQDRFHSEVPFSSGSSSIRNFCGENVVKVIMIIH